jgi:glycosyltransferase involved in cell wall biosynthesis
LHIGLNLLFIIPGQNGGTQTYSESLVKALAETAPADYRFTVFVSEEGAALDLPPNVRKVVCPVHSARRERRYLYEQTVFPSVLLRHKLDLLHSLGYVGPVFSPCPHVVTVHDVNFLAIPSAMSSVRQTALNKLVPLVARRSARVIAVSEFTKTQITEFLGVPAERICVTHEGPRPLSELPEENWTAIAAQYEISGPYLLAFDSLSGHKNIGPLLKAFASIASSVSQILVLVGHRPAGSEAQTQITALGLNGRVKLTGYVPDSHVMPLLAHADLFVFPSLYEGFGLPVLEAQAAGVAVACSTAASLPEVAGDGAAFFAPSSQDEMARVLVDCLLSPVQREALIVRGRANVARFSWARTAAATLECYRAALKQ